MNPRPLFLASITLATCFGGPAFAQSGTFTPQVSVFNNLNSSAGSHGIGIAANDTPSIFFTRSVNVWSDTWWQWTMGTDNKLRLGFSTVPQLTFQNGALGLGTDNPENRLHIGNGDLRISRASGSWGPNLLLDGTKVGSGGALWGITSATSSDTAGAGRLAFWANGAQHVVITANGNVGIGTNNPGAKLDVVGSIRSLGSGFQAWGSGQLQLQFVNQGDPADQRITELIQQDGIFTGRFVNDAYGAAESWITVKRNAGTYTVQNVMFPSGNVGIGTTNPTHKLAVNGTIKAKEVIVETTGWSDYVFADSYALTPLTEVEAHIAEKKHLPGIPSAAEVAENGISVGDMQARLLAKIEELTLHIIAQEKRLDAQQAEINRLRIHPPKEPLD